MEDIFAYHNITDNGSVYYETHQESIKNHLPLILAYSVIVICSLFGEFFWIPISPVLMFSAITGGQKNKAGYMATPVACGWVGAIIEVTRSFGQEQ